VPKDASVSYLTLAVTPEQAQALTLLSERSSSMTVSLRPFGDSETKSLAPFTEPISRNAF
jgi:hypothetical protein